MQETHRPGHLKQSNKPHKHGRHKSKGAINAMAKGKVSVKVITQKMKGQLSKQDRRHQVQQLRTKKRQDALMKKRQISGSNAPPCLVALVPLGFETIPEKLLNEIMAADPEAKVTYSQQNVLHLSLPRWKQRFSFLIPSRGNLYAVLDAAKVADTVVFLMSATSSTYIDGASEKVLTCLLSQGLPTPGVVLLDLESIPLKKRAACKQQAQKSISQWLPEEKIAPLEKNGDSLNLLRRIGGQKRRVLNHRESRSYLLGEHVEFDADETATVGTIKVSGYLRGQTLSANSLVHIPGWGDFQMSRIDGPVDPHPLEQRSTCEEDEILQVAEPNKQISLTTENVPDPMDAEQTWPTQEELDEAKNRKKIVKKVPKGTSDYQACWIPDEEGELLSDEDSNDEEEMDAESGEESEESEWEEKAETQTNTEGEVDVEKYDANMDADEEGEALAKLRASREEAAFPDEIDTPHDVTARERFAKYRGLASFRTSPWDVKENLPPDYARIFQFANFDRTRRRIMNELKENLDGVQAGTYVRIHIVGVPRERYNQLTPGEPLVVFGLLPHEHKMSVVHLLMKRTGYSTVAELPVKSKDPVIIHCGFRRYKGRPIYSQHTNGTKHKYERFLQPEATGIASLFAPITFPPTAVLMFTESGALLATGRVLSANPDRLIIKRAILSGHPFRVLKHSAIIRFMFFNREDIEWFKPVELRTKYGRRGHIKESLGTHGHMKAVFDDQLKSQDTVMMMLYKRVYPPWSYEEVIPEAPTLYKQLATICEEEEMEK